MLRSRLRRHVGVLMTQLASSTDSRPGNGRRWFRTDSHTIRGLPPATRVLLCALGVTSVPDQDAWLIAADRLRRAKPVDAAVANPYPGLRPYDVGDDRFFR